MVYLEKVLGNFAHLVLIIVFYLRKLLKIQYYTKLERDSTVRTLNWKERNRAKYISKIIYDTILLFSSNATLYLNTFVYISIHSQSKRYNQKLKSKIGKFRKILLAPTQVDKRKRKWPINWCAFLMMIQNITPSADYN